MNALIIEDEALAAERLELMLAEMDPTIKVLAKIGFGERIGEMADAKSGRSDFPRHSTIRWDKFQHL
jgi:hypothetical protein